MLFSLCGGFHMKKHCSWTFEEEKNLKLHSGWEAWDIDNSVHSRPPSWASEHKASLSTYHRNLREGLITFRWWKSLLTGTQGEHHWKYALPSHACGLLAWRCRKQQGKVRMRRHRDELSEQVGRMGENGAGPGDFTKMCKLLWQMLTLVKS